MNTSSEQIIFVESLISISFYRRRRLKLSWKYDVLLKCNSGAPSFCLPSTSSRPRAHTPVCILPARLDVTAAAAAPVAPPANSDLDSLVLVAHRGEEMIRKVQRRLYMVNCWGCILFTFRSCAMLPEPSGIGQITGQ